MNKRNEKIDVSLFSLFPPSPLSKNPFLKRFYLLLEKERKRNIDAQGVNINRLPLARSQPGPGPQPRHVTYQESNLRTLALWDHAQCTEPQLPGLKINLKFFFKEACPETPSPNGLSGTSWKVPGVNSGDKDDSDEASKEEKLDCWAGLGRWAAIVPRKAERRRQVC